MLVLSRKIGEVIEIGEGVAVTVVAIQGNRVRLGIVAPEGVRIIRQELADVERVERLADEDLQSHLESEAA